jgi:hypothetical protein
MKRGKKVLRKSNDNEITEIVNHGKDGTISLNL